MKPVFGGTLSLTQSINEASTSDCFIITLCSLVFIYVIAIFVELNSSGLCIFVVFCIKMTEQEY